MQLESKIQELDTAASSRLLEEDKIASRKLAQHDLWLWLKRKESIWAQKSRMITWLKEGDQNTKFFDTIASIRKRKNLISSLAINGSVTNDPAIIKKRSCRLLQKYLC